MYTRYQAPHTADGRLKEIACSEEGRFTATVEFPITPEFVERVGADTQHLLFSTRSRIARLGVNIEPDGKVVFEKGRATLAVTGAPTIKGFALDKLIARVFLPGLDVGRLVYCDPKCRLDANEIYECIETGEIQLPSPISVDSLGRIVFQAHTCVYDFERPLSALDLLNIVGRPDGKLILNRLQRRREVKHIVLEPRDGIITSCTMFLHRHFVVLDPANLASGQHLQAVALDPVETRGSRIFLEFANHTDHRIINPCATGAVFNADSSSAPIAKKFFIPAPSAPEPAEETGEAQFEAVEALYRYNNSKTGLWGISEQAAVVLDASGKVLDVGRRTVSPAHENNGEHPFGALLKHFYPRHEVHSQKNYLDALLHRVPGDRLTIVLEFFPNLEEHLALLQAARSGRLGRLVFRTASLQHGPFFSENDHTYMAEYDRLGVEIHWCNTLARHVARLCSTARRHYFVSPEAAGRFDDALVLAVYGSTVPMASEQEAKLRDLFSQLHTMFGKSIALLTGGGAGVMGQAFEIAKQQGMLAGANFLEGVDFQMNGQSDFYQAFQSQARHLRQRWFEIGRFHLFCIGGLGTLEEIGLTLCDMKLGLIETEPLVFFGSAREQPFWSHLQDQLHTIAHHGLGPNWLRTHVLVTDDPNEVVAFYRKSLQFS